MTPESFAAFYALYPRKVARKAAEKAWSRVATSEALIEQIMAGLRAQLPAMMKKEKAFIPYPGTWLNQHRWLDETEDEKIIGAIRRFISCNKCGDTGVLMCEMEKLGLCSCRIGQLPGVLAGVEEGA